MATANAAGLLALRDRGIIAPGLRADLLVLDGNPARSIEDADKVVETWVAGRPAAF